MDEQGQGRPTADKVLAYLLDHPQAQDTMEGIVEWWLLEQRIRHAVADIEVALRDLVSKEYIIAHQRTDGRISYRLNREQEPQIREHLNKSQASHASIKIDRIRTSDK